MFSVGSEVDDASSKAGLLPVHSSHDADGSYGVDDVELHHEVDVEVCDSDESCASDVVSAHEIEEPVLQKSSPLSKHDLALVNCVRKFGRHWEFVKRKIRSKRTPQALRLRYDKLNCPGKVASTPMYAAWTAEEDADLLLHVSRRGAHSSQWKRIASRMRTSRSEDAIRHRYKLLASRRGGKDSSLPTANSDLIPLCKKGLVALGLAAPSEGLQYDTGGGNVREMPRAGSERGSNGFSKTGELFASNSDAEFEDEVGALRRIREVAAQLAKN